MKEILNRLKGHHLIIEKENNHQAQLDTIVANTPVQNPAAATAEMAEAVTAGIETTIGGIRDTTDKMIGKIIETDEIEIGFRRDLIGMMDPVVGDRGVGLDRAVRRDFKGILILRVIINRSYPQSSIKVDSVMLQVYPSSSKQKMKTSTYKILETWPIRA